MESERLSSTPKPGEPSAQPPSSAQVGQAPSDFYPAVQGRVGSVAAEWSHEASGTISRAELRGPRPTLRDGVRRAVLDDAAAIAGLQVLSREYGFEQGLVPPPQTYDFDHLVECWQARLGQGSASRTFLGLSAGEPAGFIAAGPGRSGIGWEAEVYSLHVHPRFWRSRVVPNLAAAALDFLTQRGFAAVRMWVTESNSTVIDTLTARGFSMLEQRLHQGRVQLAFIQRLT